MSKYRSPQIGNQQIQSEHLVSGIAVNSVILSGNLTTQKAFQLQQSLGLQGQNVSYNLDSFLGTTGGTVTGSVSVVGAVSGTSSISVPSGSSLLVHSTLSGADLLQALASLHSSVTASSLKRLTDGGTLATGDHTHSLSSLSGQSEFELNKTATASGDTIALTSGTFSNLQVPSGTVLISSDIEAFINGQLLEYGSDNGYLFSGGIVTFTAAIPGDFLGVIWRGSSAASQTTGSSGTTLSSGTGGSGAGDSGSNNQVNTSGSTTTSGTTLSSGTGGAGAGDSGSNNQVNTSGSTTTSGTTLSSGTGGAGAGDTGSNQTSGSGSTTTSGTTLSSGTGGAGAGDSGSNQTSGSGSTTTSGTTLSSGTGGAGAGDSGSNNQANTSGSSGTSTGTTISNGTGDIGGSSNTLPAPSSIQFNESGTASWSAIAGTSAYQYQFTTSSTPTSSWTTTPSLGAYQSLSGYGGQTVYLFVRAENSSNYGTASRAVPFAAPSSASLTSGGSASWSSVSGATNYQYQISLSSTPDSSWTLTSATSASVNLSGYSNQTVYLHVRVADASAYATASVTLSSPLAAPSSVSLSSLGSATWSGVTGASSYEYQFTTSSTPDTGWTQTADTSASVSTSAYGGQTLYVHVRAYGSTNVASASASIPYAAPATATLTSGGLASWSAVTNAASYEYQVTSSMSPGMGWTTTYASSVSVSLAAYSNQTVYLYVRATGGSSYATASVTLQAAAPTGLNLTNSGTASWNSVVGATYYEYQITTSSTPGMSWTQTMGTSGYQNISSYTGQTVYLFVRVQGSTNYASTSITVSGGASGPPTGLSLTSGGSASWNSVMGASGYEYNLTTSSSPSGSWTTTYSTSLSLSLSAYQGQTVYLHVRVLGSMSYSSTSTSVASAQGGSLAAPATVTINSGGTAYWSSVSGATGYEYQLSTSATPGGSWTTTPGTTASFNLSAYSGQTVYLHVRAQGSTDYGTGSVSVSASEDNGINYGPIFPSSLPTQSGTVGVAYTYTIPSNAATDANNDPLTYSVSGLPAWLSYNSGTRVLSGTPTVTGSFSITVSVSDGRGGTNSTTLDYTISANQTPTIPAVSTQNLTPGVPFSVTLPEATDPEGQSVTYSVDGLPEWASFSSVNRMVLGTPSIESEGVNYPITYYAVDGVGNSGSSVFYLNVANNDNAPIIANAIPDQSATINTAFSYTIAENFASDPDGDTVSIVSVTGLPETLSYSSSTRTISGTPTVESSYTITVTVSDGKGRTVTDTFTLTVSDASLFDSYTLSSIPVQQVWGTGTYGFSYSGNSYTSAAGWNLDNSITFYKNGTSVYVPDWASYFTLQLTSSMSYVTSEKQEDYSDPAYPYSAYALVSSPTSVLNFIDASDSSEVVPEGKAYFKEVATFVLTEGTSPTTGSMVFKVVKQPPILTSGFGGTVTGAYRMSSDGVTWSYPTQTGTASIQNRDGIGTISLTDVTSSGPVSITQLSQTLVRIVVGPFSAPDQTATWSFKVTDGYLTSSAVSGTRVGGPESIL